MEHGNYNTLDVLGGSKRFQRIRISSVWNLGSKDLRKSKFTGVATEIENVKRKMHFAFIEYGRQTKLFAILPEVLI